MQRFWNMEGKDVAQGDQRLDIRAGDYGLWNISAYWDRIPHLYSTDSELIYDRVARDEFRLAAADQAYLNGVVGNHTAVQDRFDALSSNFDLDSKETYYGFKVGGRPTPDWDVGASWERQEQDGTKALGGMITFFNINEVPAPMDYTTDQVEAWAEWAKKKGYVSMRFSGSWFNDAVELIQAGEVYFVRDGHHRVSVARASGNKYIDAIVTKVTLGACQIK